MAYSHWFPTGSTDATSVLEVSRRVLQDQLVTRHLGGVFPREVASATLKTALDIQCGPGGWVLDAVATHPSLQGLGVDINASLIQYATMLSVAENVQATFHRMDVMEPKSALLLPNNVFEFVNARFVQLQVRPLWWNVLLRECWRCLAPLGVLHLTEFESMSTNSSALDAFLGLLSYALIRTRRRVALTSNENRRVFDACLMWCGFQGEPRRFITVNYHPGTEMFEVWREVFFLTFHQVQPFLLQSGMTTAPSLRALWTAIERDMGKADFFARLTLSSLCVIKPMLEVFESHRVDGHARALEAYQR